MGELSRQGVRAALDEENLAHFNWFEDRLYRPDEVGILARDEGLLVYSTDECAAAAYSAAHVREEAALKDFLQKLRATNRYFALRQSH